MNSKNAIPFLKWVGGKRQLLEQFEQLYPTKLLNNKITKYVEPFLGGGSVFFELQNKFHFKEIVLNDINKEIICAYKVIQNNVDNLIDNLSYLEESYLSSNEETRKKIYYEIRDRFNLEKNNIRYNEISKDLIFHISHLIFLNRTCFNGLYRLNKSGKFNVPIGSYRNPTICDKENLKKVNKVLQGVTLVYGEYYDVEKYIDINEDTFVYIDPPYRPLPNSPSFTSYSNCNFNEEKQIELSEWFKKLINEKKAQVMLSNSDPKNTDIEDNFFDALYDEENISIEKVIAKRNINSKGNKRGPITEIVVRNK